VLQSFDILDDEERPTLRLVRQDSSVPPPATTSSAPPPSAIVPVVAPLGAVSVDAVSVDAMSVDAVSVDAASAEAFSIDEPQTTTADRRADESQAVPLSRLPSQPDTLDYRDLDGAALLGEFFDEDTDEDSDEDTDRNSGRDTETEIEVCAETVHDLHLEQLLIEEQAMPSTHPARFTTMPPPLPVPMHRTAPAGGRTLPPPKFMRKQPADAEFDARQTMERPRATMRSLQLEPQTMIDEVEALYPASEAIPLVRRHHDLGVLAAAPVPAAMLPPPQSAAPQSAAPQSARPPSAAPPSVAPRSVAPPSAAPPPAAPQSSVAPQSLAPAPSSRPSRRTPQDEALADEIRRLRNSLQIAGVACATLMFVCSVLAAMLVLG
jgi:hypothetical protein